MEKKKTGILVTAILVALATLASMFLLIGAGKSIKLIAAAAIIVKIVMLVKEERSVMRTSILVHLLLLLLFPDYWTFIVISYILTWTPLLLFKIIV